MVILGVFTLLGGIALAFMLFRIVWNFLHWLFERPEQGEWLTLGDLVERYDDQEPHWILPEMEVTLLARRRGVN